jgi:hypothetical protein
MISTRLVSRVVPPCATPLVTQLFDSLVQTIGGKGSGKAWVAIPELIDWTTFDLFDIEFENSVFGQNRVQRPMFAAIDNNPRITPVRYDKFDGNHLS